MSAVEDLLGGLRQLRFARPFRIPAPPWPDGWEAALETAVAHAPAPTPPELPASQPAAPDPEWLADLGTGLWRLRQRMVEPGTDRPLEEMRRAFRHLDSLLDVTRGAGLEIQDHTGISYHAGMALQVLAFQPTPGTHRDHVEETIKPTIYLHGTLIQMGEVIVATPEVQP